jgi:hypothetical protein
VRTGTLTNVGTSGFPSMRRGVYFDGTNAGMIAFPGYVINARFSLHSWMHFANSATTKRVLYHKEGAFSIYQHNGRLYPQILT